MPLLALLPPVERPPSCSRDGLVVDSARFGCFVWVVWRLSRLAYIHPLAEPYPSGNHFSTRASSSSSSSPSFSPSAALFYLHINTLNLHLYLQAHQQLKESASKHILTPKRGCPWDMGGRHTQTESETWIQTGCCCHFGFTFSPACSQFAHFWVSLSLLPSMLLPLLSSQLSLLSLVWREFEAPKLPSFRCSR